MDRDIQRGATIEYREDERLLAESDPAEAAQVHKVRENRVRRAAIRQGYRLVKSRRRDPRAIDYGAYWIVQPKPYAALAVLEGTPTAGLPTMSGSESGMTLEQVEDWLLN